MIQYIHILIMLIENINLNLKVLVLSLLFSSSQTEKPIWTTVYASISGKITRILEFFNDIVSNINNSFSVISLGSKPVDHNDLEAVERMGTRTSRGEALTAPTISEP